MKNALLILTIVFFIRSLSTIHGQETNTDQFTVEVDGLGCPFCAYGLEKKFKEFKGIKNLKIEMETGMMTFEYPAEKALGIAEVSEKVTKAGYTPVLIRIATLDGEVVSTENAKVEKKSNNFEQDMITSFSFQIAGNCEMCKARIENTLLKIEKVQTANWDVATKTVTIIAEKEIKQVDLESAIAKAGHDTNNVKADSKAYTSLPGCCQYERIE